MNDGLLIHSVHLVSERKFLPWIKELFKRPGWSSTFVVLKYNENNYIHTLDDNETEVSTDEFGLNHILTILENKNVMFHYFLDFPKTEIVLRSQPWIMHYWYFFGAEIYQQTKYFRKELYGPATKQLMWLLPEIRFRYHFRYWYYRLALGKKTPIQNLQKAIPKISNILWYIDDEIGKLRTKITLPPLLPLQFFTFNNIIPDENSQTDRKNKRILIGNSATIENNHMDVLEVIKSIRQHDYLFTLPLTYGQFKRYKTKLKSKFRKYLGDNVYFLEEHLKLREYYAFLNQHPTAIFLHYRQQGLGNIFYMLYSGTKIYLSNKNIIFHWLKKNGLAVFTFEDEFNNDYKNDKLVLPDSLMAQNKIAIRRLLTYNSNDSTFEKIELDIRTKANNVYEN